MSDTTHPLDELKEFCIYMHNVMSRSVQEKDAWVERLEAIRELECRNKAMLATRLRSIQESERKNKALLAACTAFVELFGDSDMRPEDECHELYQQMKTAIAESEGRATS